MATPTAILCPHFSVLSFSSHISSASSQTLSLPFPAGKPRPLRLSSLNTRPLAAAAAGFAEAPAEEIYTVDLEKYVKSRLPGGFAAQKIFGAGRGGASALSLVSFSRRGPASSSSTTSTLNEITVREFAN